MCSDTQETADLVTLTEEILYGKRHGIRWYRKRPAAWNGLKAWYDCGSLITDEAVYYFYKKAKRSLWGRN